MDYLADLGDLTGRKRIFDEPTTSDAASGIWAGGSRRIVWGRVGLSEEGRKL